MDMEQRDYDSRTALHVAAAEGYKLPFVLGVQVCVLVWHADMQVCVYVCFVVLLQDTPRWSASCWKPAKSIRFPKTGETFRNGNVRWAGWSSSDFYFIFYFSYFFYFFYKKCTFFNLKERIRVKLFNRYQIMSCIVEFLWYLLNEIIMKICVLVYKEQIHHLSTE